MTLSRTQACARLSALGFRQSEVHRVIDEVEKWNRESGPEWTVARLKTLKNDFVRQLAGLDGSSEWISFRGGKPKGPLRVLWNNTTRRRLVRSLNGLMIYSSHVSARVTQEQWKKFQCSVENPPASDLAVEDSIGRLNPLRHLRKQVSPSDLRKPRFSQYPWSPERRAPVGNRTCPESDIMSWLKDSASDGTVRIAAQRWPGVFEHLRPYVRQFWQSMPNWDSPDSVGRVSFIQEPGYKLRAVANPNRVHQLALEPLKTALWSVLARLSNDCTYDQMKGVHKVQGWLQAGRRVHCVDLSDATNNFPLSLQLRVASDTLGSEWSSYLQYFEYCAKGPWRVKDPELNQDREIRWSKGQPLGLGPSFGIFALAHHAVVKTALGKSRDAGSDYVLLGDDIALVGDSFHKEYLDLLGGLGCPVSVNKCLSSQKAAEFAGKVVTRDTIFQPYKWKETSDRSFLDTARNLGPGSYPLFRRKQREVIDRVSEIPEDFGGLGWNPYGKPYQQRVEENLNTIKMLEVEGNLRPYRDEARLERKLQLELNLTKHMGVLEHFQGLFDGVASRDSDQEPLVDRSHKGLVARFMPGEEYFRDDDDLVRGYTPCIRESDPRGATTLSSYQRKLGLLRSRKGPEPER